MNCVEALNHHLKQCERCILKAFILEFEELPEEQKFNFDYYEKDKHFIIHCKECNIYKTLPED